MDNLGMCERQKFGFDNSTVNCAYVTNRILERPKLELKKRGVTSINHRNMGKAGIVAQRLYSYEMRLPGGALLTEQPPYMRAVLDIEP